MHNEAMAVIMAMHYDQYVPVLTPVVTCVYIARTTTSHVSEMTRCWASIQLLYSIALSSSSALILYMDTKYDEYCCPAFLRHAST